MSTEVDRSSDLAVREANPLEAIVQVTTHVNDSMISMMRNRMKMSLSDMRYETSMMRNGINLSISEMRAEKNIIHNEMDNLISDMRHQKNIMRNEINKIVSDMRTQKNISMSTMRIKIDRMRNKTQESITDLYYSPSLEFNLDSTARGILVMGFLGQPVGVGKMLEKFATGGHFRTYAKDREPSLSATCYAIMAILCQKDASMYAPRIKEAMKFICDIWWNSDRGLAEDKSVRG
ncbi:hypothetical protein GGR51DRAFT_569644 [Nemania sp. FL0031]|nr:hypothetical protein GGR51DRAFT_569644 [Nemania sp. FL0031]